MKRNAEKRKKNVKVSAAKKSPVIFQAKSGAIEFRGDFSHNTIWATQNDLIKLYEKDQSVISRHIKNIFRDGEVDKKSNMQKMHIANSDKPVTLYSLDIILAVGYRTNSQRAIEFRKWSTKILKGHLLKGYTINKKVLERNQKEAQRVLEDLEILVKNNKKISSSEILELVKSFSTTWFSLDRYDKDSFPKKGFTKKKLKISVKELYEDIESFKSELIKKEEATDLFAQEKKIGNLEGILGNVFQAAFGQEMYPTVEEKAAHLLYFVIKFVVNKVNWLFDYKSNEKIFIRYSMLLLNLHTSG